MGCHAAGDTAGSRRTGAGTVGATAADTVRTAVGDLFRTALVVFTLVVSGLFVGTGLYDAMVDNGTEGRRAAAAVAGALVVVGLACALLLVEPVVVRHRLRLTPAGRPFAPALWAVAELGAAEGTRVHGVLIGPATLRRPFVVGRPGDYRIVLPPALARLEDPALFRTLVRHELTALGRRDVAAAWLAGSLRYVVGPLLAVPVIVELAHGEPQAAAERIGHSVLLVGVVLLALGAWRAARRPAVLSGADGLALGFLAALALPLTIGVATPLGPTLTVLVGALVVGPAFGATAYCGLRQALAGPPGRPTRSVTFGVLVGGLLAVPSSLGPGFGLPMLSLVAVPVALAGATAFIGGRGGALGARPVRLRGARAAHRRPVRRGGDGRTALDGTGGAARAPGRQRGAGGRLAGRARHAAAARHGRRAARRRGRARDRGPGVARGPSGPATTPCSWACSAASAAGWAWWATAWWSGRPPTPPTCSTCTSPPSSGRRWWEPCRWRCSRWPEGSPGSAPGCWRARWPP